MSHYGFRISVGTGTIIASRKSGWPSVEREVVVVLGKAAVLAEWQEKLFSSLQALRGPQRH